MSVRQLCGQVTFKVAESHLIRFQTHTVSFWSQYGLFLQCWMTTRRQAGSTSMETSSDSLPTRMCSVLLLAQELR